MRRNTAVLALAIASGIALFLPARAARADDPTIELYTMGPGDDPFSAFGHAAICVIDMDHPAGRCFNYGTANFDSPVPLGWKFLRGRAQFYVSQTSVDHMIGTYQAADRTVYRQTLPLTPIMARGLTARLVHDALPENRYYQYNHFSNNCSTKLRDLIDGASGGALRVGSKIPYGPTYRELARVGFASHLPIEIVTETILGRAGDREPTLWEAMFLPEVLRAEVERRFDAVPEVVYERKAPPRGGNPASGRHALFAFAVALALLCGLGAIGARATRRRWPWRTAVIVVAGVLGLLAVAFDGVAIVTVLRELRGNELLLVFLPTDLALVFLGERNRRRYLAVRLLGLIAVAALRAAGALVQPLWAPMAVPALPFLVIVIGELAGWGRTGERTDVRV